MSNEYVRRQDALTKLCDYICGELVDPCNSQKDCKFYKIIKSLEPVDVVPVVRCEDCRYRVDPDKCCHPDGMLRSKDNDFCSYGERKE